MKETCLVIFCNVENCSEKFIGIEVEEGIRYSWGNVIDDAIEDGWTETEIGQDICPHHSTQRTL